MSMTEKIDSIVTAHINAGLSQKRITLNVSAEELLAYQRELEETFPNSITYNFPEVNGTPRGVATVRMRGYTVWLLPE